MDTKGEMMNPHDMKKKRAGIEDLNWDQDTNQDTAFGYQVRMARMEISSVPKRLAELREAADRAGVLIICMNAEMMAGRRHAEEAIRQAIRAKKEGTMTARSLEMEVLLYVSGQRQTSIAMGFGLHEGGMLTWIGLVPPSDSAWSMLEGLIRLCPDEEEIPASRIPGLQELFGITDEEINTVGRERICDLVIERTALLNILK